MGKGGPKKAKPKTAAPPAAASSSAAGGAFRSRAVGAVLLAAFAIGLQALLSSNAPSAGRVEVPPPPRGPPPACPADWPACPRSAGVDWAAADAAEAESDLSPAALSEGLRGCNATALLSPQRVPGMHAVCILPPPTGEERAAATLVVYDSMRRAEGGKEGGRVVSLLLPARLSDASHVAAAVLRRLGVRPRPRTPSGQYQPAALFTDRGVRVVSVEGLLSLASGSGAGTGHYGGGAARALLLEGGQWLWPPVKVGHAHELTGLVAPGVVTRVVTLSLKPLVVEVENFLDGGENGHIIERAKPHMAKSGVALKDADKGKAAKEFRTSSQYFLPTTGDPTLEKIDRRVSWLTRIPISHAEYIQVLKYNHLEHYSAHHDYFDPAAYASNQQMLRSVEHGAKNRLATVFFYLNSLVGEGEAPESGGGQTNFPRAATAAYPDGGPPVHDYFDCSRGLSVYPQEGKIIIFYSMLPNGEMDDYSLHGGGGVLFGHCEAALVEHHSFH